MAAGAGAAEAAAGGGAGVRRLRDGIDAAGEAGAGDGASGWGRTWPWGDGPSPALPAGPAALGKRVSATLTGDSGGMATRV